MAVTPLLQSLIREWHVFCSVLEWQADSAMSVPEQVELMRRGLRRAKREQARAFLALTSADVADAIGGNFLWR